MVEVFPQWQGCLGEPGCVGSCFCCWLSHRLPQWGSLKHEALLRNPVRTERIGSLLGRRESAHEFESLSPFRRIFLSLPPACLPSPNSCAPRGLFFPER